MIRAVLDRLTGRREARAVTDADFWTGAALPTTSSMGVTPHAAENLSAVLACVNAIASAAASLTPLVYRLGEAGREEAPAHPVARLLRWPNPHQTWPDFAEWLLASTLLRGNGLAEMVFDGAGRPVELVPIPWGNASPVLLPSGRLAFDVVGFQGPFGGTGRSRRLMPGEFLHLKDRSDDGYVGRSRLSRARARWWAPLLASRCSRAACGPTRRRRAGCCRRNRKWRPRRFRGCAACSTAGMSGRATRPR